MTADEEAVASNATPTDFAPLTSDMAALVGAKLEPKAAPPAEPLASELEQKLADSIRMVETRKAAQRAETAMPAWTEALVTQTNALVDAYAAVLRHSSKHEGLVKGEDIRSIFLSAFINVSKSGVKNVA